MKHETKHGQTIDMSLADSSDLSTLRQKTGILKKIDVAFATSHAAGKGLKAVQIGQVEAETNIALTGLKLAEAAILTSMLANAMPAMGALTTRVNAAITSVDQALTNGVMAEVYTHLRNRAQNIGLATELRASGTITPDESEVIASFAQADAASDIQRSRERMTDAKAAVSALHEFALKGIADTKNRLS